jgi:hypothetical protein
VLTKSFVPLLSLFISFLFQMYRLTIRATDESLPSLLLKAMEDQLSQGGIWSSGNSGNSPVVGSGGGGAATAP